MTKEERQQLLSELTLMVLEDFGEASDNEQFNPFSPADVARQGVIMLRAAYKEHHEIDRISDNIYEAWLDEVSEIIYEAWADDKADLDSDDLSVVS